MKTKVKKEFYSVKDLKIIIGCKKTEAYRIIQQLNNDLQDQGIMTINGRILKRYFDKQYGLKGEFNE